MYWFFPGDYPFSFRTLRVIGNCHYGQGEFGEIMQVVEQIRSGDYDSWCTAWTKMGDKCYAEAKVAEEHGHLATSCSAYNRATNYYHASQFYLPHDDPRKMPAYLRILECFEKGTRFDVPAPERVKIPYEDSFLYAWYVRPATPLPENGKSPCIVWFGGLDSTAEEVYYCIAKDMTRRGMSMLLVDGPGQGASIRLNNVFSRHDYEKAGTAAFDYLETRDDVELDKVALMGWSLGGYYCPRIACFEHRYSALVTYSAIFDYGEVWHLRPDNHPMMPYLKWILNKDTVEEAREEVSKFTFDNGELAGIQCPALICYSASDQQNQSEDLAQRLVSGMCNSPQVVFRIFTPEEGGSEHVSADNMSHANAVAGDWLQDLFGLAR